MGRVDLTFRVFVSSTFGDMIEERNSLQERVFPKLREYCLRRGARFQAIDLRWGVSEEAALDQQTMNICLQELKRCQDISPRPNFIILLGDRYGWRPLPPQIEATEFELLLNQVPIQKRGLLRWEEDQPEGLRGWYRRDDNAVPSEYVLQARHVALEDGWAEEREQAARDEEAARWRDRIEPELHSLLLKAACRVWSNSNDPRRQRYEDSATHQEIRHGALSVRDPGSHGFAYLRTIDGLPGDFRAKDYRDIDRGTVDHKAQERLEDLKAELRGILPSDHVYEYRSTWLDNQPAVDLQGLCDRVERDLRKVIDAELKAFLVLPELAHEIEAHKTFGQQRAEHFIGRHELLGQIATYVAGDNNRPFVVCGASGSGKTALIARAAELLVEGQEPTDGSTVISRFVGATPASSDIHLLLEGLGRQISVAFCDERPVPSCLRELAEDFLRRLALATAEHRLVILLDGLDQLAPTGGAQYLNWLPRELPAHTKLIVSVLESDGAEGACSRIARGLVPAKNLARIHPLPEQQGEQLLDAWLEQAHRRLQPEQRHSIIGSFATNGLPLYLKLAFGEASHWKSYESPPPVSAEVTGLVREMADRLAGERLHGQVLTGRALGYLAAARHGLTEDELLDVLSTDADVLADFRRRSPRSPQTDRLPVVIWSRLHADLKPYLAERRADGTVVITFYHRSVGEVIGARYLAGGSHRARHMILARYFESKPNWSAGGSARGGPYVRKMSELPYHLEQAGLDSDLERLLCDLQFLEAKCAAGLIRDLMQDCDRSVSFAPSSSVASVRRAASLALPGILAMPHRAASLIYNRLRWLESEDPKILESLHRGREYLDSKGPWILATAPLPAGVVGDSLTMSYPFQACLQCLAPDRSALALADPDGRAEVLELARGTTIAEHVLHCPPIQGVAVAANGARVAYIDREGLLRTVNSRAALNGRRNERLLAFYSSSCLVAVGADDTLVTWDSETGLTAEIVRDLPAPIVVLRVRNQGRSALVVAGEARQRIILLDRIGDTWRIRSFPEMDPPVTHADLSEDGRYVLLAGRDRGLRILDAATAVQLAGVWYERHETVHAVGEVRECAFGTGETADQVFVATASGHLLRWHFATGTLDRLANYCTSTQPLGLVLFECLSPQGRLFLSTSSGGTEVRANQGRRPENRHDAPVTHCFATNDEAVVSLSIRDQCVRWSSAEGGSPLYESQYVREPSAMTQSGHSRDALMANRVGVTWRLPPLPPLPQESLAQHFAEPVVSLLDVGGDGFIAAGDSGTVKLIRSRECMETVLWQSVGMSKQRKLCHSGRPDSCWSLREEQREGGIWQVVSLLKVGAREETVLEESDRVLDLAVADTGERICVAGQSVRILEQRRRGWMITRQRPAPATHVAFTNGGAFLAVALAASPWLELWEVSDELPTVAAVHLPVDVSCLATCGDRVAVGCVSGDVLCLRVRANRIRLHNT